MRIRLGELGLRPIRSCAHDLDNHWTSKAINILFPFVGSYIFYVQLEEEYSTEEYLEEVQSL